MLADRRVATDACAAGRIHWPALARPTLRSAMADLWQECLRRLETTLEPTERLRRVQDEEALRQLEEERREALREIEELLRAMQDGS